MIYRSESATWATNGSCNKCGKPYIYIGNIPYTGFIKGLEPYCTCNENNYNMNKDSSNIFTSGNQGWVCPKCNRVLSPSVFECAYCNNTNITSNWSSTDTVTLGEDNDTQYTFTDKKE